MKRISSLSTPLQKYGASFFCVAMLVYLQYLPQGWALLTSSVWVPLLFVAAGVGGLLLGGNLADAVHDTGESLRVRHRGIEEIIPCAEISAVEEDLWFPPRAITLRLKRPRQLGAAIRFLPAFDAGLLFPGQGSQVARDLRWRCGMAKYR